jgi:ABC-type multidrug transport system fused ATPase/permease subunit
MPNSLTKFFLHFALKQPVAFIIFFVSPISIVLKTNVVPYALKLIVDAISTHQADRSNIFELLNGAIWLGGGAWFGLIFIERFQYWMQSIAIPKFEADMRLSVLKYSMNHSYEYFCNQFAGNLVNKVMSLIRSMDAIRKILSWNIITAFSVIVVSIILVYTVSFIFSFIISVWVALQIAITLYFVKHINTTSSKNAEDKSVISGLIVDIISNMASVKLFTREPYELLQVNQAQRIEQKSNARLISITNTFCLLLDFFVSLVLLFSFYFLIKGWQNNSVTTGDIVLVFYLIFSVMNQMWQLGYALGDLFREIGVAQQALKTITQTVAVTDVPNAKPLIIEKGKIEFRNIKFNYNKSEDLFQNLNLLIEPNQKVGIVGNSGGGKSSFVSLLLRFYDLKSGGIFIDGQDISQVKQASLRESISVILQDTTLFHRTLLDNICYGKIDATEEEIFAASKNAHCHDFIERLSQKYHTFSGERGVKLSGGQRQRILIARALLKNSPIVILDEATSALDSITERLIQKSLDELMKNKTVIVIAHRLSTLLKMDRILVFNEGKIVEDGKHEILIKAGGCYADMWQNQVDGFFDKENLMTDSGVIRSEF